MLTVLSDHESQRLQVSQFWEQLDVLLETSQTDTELIDSISFDLGQNWVDELTFIRCLVDQIESSFSIQLGNQLFECFHIMVWPNIWLVVQSVEIQVLTLCLMQIWQKGKFTRLQMRIHYESFSQTRMSLEQVKLEELIIIFSSFGLFILHLDISFHGAVIKELFFLNDFKNSLIGFRQREWLLNASMIVFVGRVFHSLLQNLVQLV